MRKYSRVTFEDRCHISAWLQTNISISEIARRLGCHKSTVSREIKRNSFSGSYSAEKADQWARSRYRSCRRAYVFKGHLKELVERKLEEQWSPQQICLRCRLENVPSVSHECIYQHIRKNKKRFAPQMRRLKRKAGCGRYRQKGAHQNSFQPNIRDRPMEANYRSATGHIERDIMFIKGKTPLLVCVDRKTRYVQIARAKDLKAQTINDLTMELIALMPFRVHTVTSDRGTEFKVPLSTVKTYYCDPQAPQQRGSVENTIGLIRQYLPRKMEPSELTGELIKEIENKLNNRPKRVLDYRTPYEVATNTTVALAS